MKFLVLTGCFMTVAIIVQCASFSLSISPLRFHVFVWPGDSFELNCTHEFDSFDDDRATFRRNNQDITDNNTAQFQIVTVLRVGSSDTGRERHYIETKTLFKNVTERRDEGVYTCYVRNGPYLMESSITVYVVTVLKKDAEMPVNDMPKQIELRCGIAMDTPLSLEIEIQYTWKHDNVSVINDTRAIIYNNGSLIIQQATRGDIGEYMCTITFYPTSAVERQEMRPITVFLNAGPKIEKRVYSKNMVEGETLDYKCEVSGYPVPTLRWKKDGQAINTSRRIHFLPQKDVLNGILHIADLDLSDDGNYTCIAENNIEPKVDKATMKLHVEERTSGAVAGAPPFLPVMLILGCLVFIFN